MQFSFHEKTQLCILHSCVFLDILFYRSFDCSLALLVVQCAFLSTADASTNSSILENISSFHFSGL